MSGMAIDPCMLALHAISNAMEKPLVTAATPANWRNHYMAEIDSRNSEPLCLQE